MLPIELLCAQCLPVTLAPENEFSPLAPWTEDFIASVPDSVWRSIAGNAMALPAVGSVLLFVLVMTIFSD